MDDLPSRHRVFAALAALLFARLALHVAVVPPFEGPDEPFHLSRVSTVARGGGILGVAPLDPAVQRAIPRHPCGPDLARAFGCPPFPGVRPKMPAVPPAPPPPAPAIVHAAYPNYENNQPPLYYAVAGGLLALSEAIVPSPSGEAPEDELRRLRVLSLLFVAAAIAGPLRRLARRRSSLFVFLGMSALFLPGFSESFVRCSNDAMVFLWAAVIVDLVDRAYRGPALPLLLAAGCLIKLNALPILVFVLVLLWRERRRGLALLSAAAAAIPVVVLGGSTWGGAVKIAKRIPRPMPAGEVVAGLARSAYTIVKGVPWVGEWSFFRPPVWLLVLGLLLGAALALGVRICAGSPRFPAHAAGLVVAIAGTFAFVLADRRVFGAWGGVGGWYVWSWAPWLALLADDTMEWRGNARWRVAAVPAYVLLFNVCWFAAAGRLYGWRKIPPGAARIPGAVANFSAFSAHSCRFSARWLFPTGPGWAGTRSSRGSARAGWARSIGPGTASSAAKSPSRS